MSGYCCQGCRQWKARPEFRRNGLGSVCSDDCLKKARNPGRELQHGAPKRKQSVPSGTVSPIIRGRVLVRDGGRCRFCGSRNGLHLHHITYLSGGGTGDEQNLITLCREHHELMHSDKKRWQPILRVYIWEVYVDGKKGYIPHIERTLAGES